jgi:hypothetical protein
VLFHTPLFMFVRPLVLLIFDNFTCFVCFVINRALHHVLIEGANGHEMMRRFLKCVRTHDLLSNADEVTRRAEDERSPVSPCLTEPALAVICGRPCVAHSIMDNWRVRTQDLRSNAGLYPACL